jgi:hypothetical protein
MLAYKDKEQNVTLLHKRLGDSLSTLKSSFLIYLLSIRRIYEN